jgi:predicted nucleic acid-binding protein
MSGIEKLVLDTNAIIKLLDDKEKSRSLDKAFPDNEKVVSIITQIELLGYPDITAEVDELIRSFLDDIVIILPDIEIIETAIQIRRNKPTLKLPDAVIAASAIALNATLVTNDDGLLKFIFPGLETLRLE